MSQEPKFEFHSELDALVGLSKELYRIATRAGDALRQLAPDPGAPDFKLAIDADHSAISTALRYQAPEKPAQFTYLGEVDIKPTAQETLNSFRPTVSLELFDLANNRNLASALAAMLTDAHRKGDTDKFQALADSCRQHLVRIMVRASLLALTIQNLTRSYSQRLLMQLLNGKPDDYQAWRSAFEAAHAKLRAALEAAYPDSTKGAMSVPTGPLVATSFKLLPNQKTINGVYFPPPHQEAILKRLAARQAGAITQASPKAPPP